jgi:DNA-binding LytR/AlgR family response regulator
VTRPATILIIDSDAAAGRELSEILLNRTPAGKTPPNVIVSLDVKPAADLLATEPVDWLFIRINQWDDYQRLVFTHQPCTHVYTRVIFLSGRAEKRTDHLHLDLDAHLQPPHRAGRLAKVWNKLSDPDFTPQPLDFFFLKVQARYIPIRYPDLYQVQRFGRECWIETRQTEYRITANLSAFQARLPIPLTRIRRGWLVNEAYQPEPPSQPSNSVPQLKTR